MEAKLKMGHKIRAARKWKNITQEQLAEQLNISQPALSKIESNDMPISYEKLTEVSEKLDFDINELLDIDPSTSFNSIQQSGGFSGIYNTCTFSAEDVKEVYGQLIEEKNKRIELLERLLESKK